MKTKLLLFSALAMVLGATSVKAQTNVGSTAAPVPSAMLQVSGTTKGFLPPVLTAAQVTTLNGTSPAVGLVIFNSTNNRMEVNTGTSAAPIWSSTNAANAWGITGNTGTVAGTNFIGTTDAIDLIFKRGNVQSGIISGGSINNTAFGLNTIPLSATGAQNAAFGSFALSSNTTGASNVAFGYTALQNSTTGISNTAVGASALQNNTANNNTAIGFASMQSNTSGTFSTAIGYGSLQNGTAGAGNTAIGTVAGANITTGGNNTTLGNGTNVATPTASNQLNIANNIFGTGLTGSVSAPAGNIGIGTANPQQRLDVYAGSQAQFVNQAGAVPVPIMRLQREGGSGASFNPMVDIELGKNTLGGTPNLNSKTTLNFKLAGETFQVPNVSVMTLAAADDIPRVGIGTTSPTQALDVAGNVKFTGALMPNNTAGTTGQVLTSAGAGAAPTWVTATVPTATAWGLLGNAGTVAGTNFLGTTDAVDVVFKRNSVQAGIINSANRNTAFGNNTNSFTAAGAKNTSLGDGSLVALTTGNENTALGVDALKVMVNGTGNVSVGAGTLALNTAGNNNVAVGTNSLRRATGSFNTAVGDFSGNQLLSGNNNTLLGNSAGLNLINGNNNIVIGQNQQTINGSDNLLNIGGMIFGTGLTGSISVPAGNIGIGTAAPTATLSVNGPANNATGVWSVFSDARLKKVDAKFTDGLNVISKLNPITFHYNEKAPFQSKDQQIGIIAQELEKVAPYMITKIDYKTKDGDELKEMREVNTQAYIFLLINSIKEQQAMINTMKAEIEILKKK